MRASYKKIRDKTLASASSKKSHNTVLDIIRRTANDNTPPVLYWFYKIFIISLIVFASIQLISIYLK